jgi:hypothetical protein
MQDGSRAGWQSVIFLIQRTNPAAEYTPAGLSGPLVTRTKRTVLAMNDCTPRARYAQRESAERAATQAVAEAKAADLAQRLADGERKSLDDPDRPAVLHPAVLPEKITIRIIPLGEVIAELEGDRANSTLQTLESDDWEATMAGAETALAALGYTLDRFRMYTDMSLVVGHFYRKDGPDA